MATSKRAERALNPLKQCAAEKTRYDACFKHWYHAHFLKGDLQMSSQCENLFEELQVCINAALQRARTRAAAADK